MPERVQQTRRPAAQQREDEVPADQPVADTAEARTKVDVADELLDEIDALLDDVVGEATAEQFVAAFIQKGGQ